jgi:hypothetical protein
MARPAAAAKLRVGEKDIIAPVQFSGTRNYSQKRE